MGSPITKNDEIYTRSKVKTFMGYLKALFDNKFNISLSMPVSPDNGFKTIYMGLTTNAFKKGHVYEYTSASEALYAFYYEFEGDAFLYYTKSATPSAGDTIYDANGDATEYTVAEYDDGSITVDYGSYQVTAARDSTKDTTATTGEWTDVSAADFVAPTDVYTKSQVYTKSETYTKSEVNAALAGKANTATSLAGYGITDAYTKTQTDTALQAKANTSTTLNGYGITDAYTKTETDNLVAGSQAWERLLSDPDIVAEESTTEQGISSLSTNINYNIEELVERYEEIRVVVWFYQQIYSPEPWGSPEIAVFATNVPTSDLVDILDEANTPSVILGAPVCLWLGQSLRTRICIDELSQSQGYKLRFDVPQMLDANDIDWFDKVSDASNKYFARMALWGKKRV